MVMASMLTRALRLSVDRYETPRASMTSMDDPVQIQALGRCYSWPCMGTSEGHPWRFTGERRPLSTNIDRQRRRLCAVTRRATSVVDRGAAAANQVWPKIPDLSGKVSGHGICRLGP